MYPAGMLIVLYSYFAAEETLPPSQVSWVENSSKVRMATPDTSVAYVFIE
jgi:hypothetical protein